MLRLRFAQKSLIPGPRFRQTRSQEEASYRRRGLGPLVLHGERDPSTTGIVGDPGPTRLKRISAHRIHAQKDEGTENDLVSNII